VSTALHLVNETQDHLLVENPGVPLQVHEVVRRKPLAGQLEGTLKQIDCASVKGLRFAPDKGILEVAFLLRARLFCGGVCLRRLVVGAGDV
jgi:hypothetical protein